MSKITAFDQTIGLMQDRLSLNTANQKVISSNLANINTPGYVAKELTFEKALRDSLEQQVLHMVRSNNSHVAPDPSPAASIPSEIVETGPVDLDSEMVRLSQNSVEYQYIVSMLNKKFNMLKHAIGEGGQ